jgi:hypothetical protein
MPIECPIPDNLSTKRSIVSAVSWVQVRFHRPQVHMTATR